MPWSGGAVSRRAALRALGLLGGLAVLPGCAADFSGTRLRVATGAVEGGYYAVGMALARVWQHDLALRVPPDVMSTKGSIDNLQLLLAGAIRRGVLPGRRGGRPADPVGARGPDGARARWPASTTTWCTW